MSKLRGALAALGLLVGMVGAPWALLSWGRLPAPGAQLRADDGTMLLVALTMVGWLAWLAFALATLAEIVTMATGRRHRILGLTTVQQLASGLLLSVVAALPVTTMLSSTPPAEKVAAPQLPPPIDTVSATPDSEPSPSKAPAAAPEPTQDSSAGSATADPPAADRASEASRGYVVRAGDDLWSIAERTLGDGRKWRSIAELNPGLEDPLGELRVGTRLTLPAETASLLATPVPKHPSRVTVTAGDTLSELALEHLGKASRWPRIAKANAMITDPDHIEVGWKLTIPGKHHDQATPAPPQSHSPLPPPPEPPPSVGSHPVDQEQDPAPESTPEQAPEIAPAPAPASEQDAPQPALPLTIGTLAATAVVGTLELRRALKLRERPVGRYEPPVSAGADRLRTALQDVQQPEALESLTGALQLIAEHCHRNRLPAPALASVRLSAAGIRFEWESSAGAPPPGFDGDERCWTPRPDLVVLPDDRPCLYPALVSLGVCDGETLLVDAERSGVLGVAGTGEQRRAALAAMTVELSCAPWSADARLVVTGTDAGLVKLTGEDRVQIFDQDSTWGLLRTQVARRRLALGDHSLAELRVDPERAEAVAAMVFCFFDELSDSEVAALDELLGGTPVGVAAIVATGSTAQARWVVEGEPDRPTGRLSGQAGELAAHSISAPERDALNELFADRDLVTAPWWGEDNVYQLPHRDGDDVDIVRLLQPATHPRLLLIGPAELHNPTGPEPARSRQQLIELCAWLAEHPGSNATQMASALLIAEGTRRSNLSRLRAWLGSDPEGEPYLPDAYSGRISLHAAVTSDWQQLQLLLRPGITKVSDQALIAALELVRGAPLADAAPTQWHWAEEMRISISSALRDVGVVLTDRALAGHDIDLARWAASRALVVAPDDELLLCARLRTEHQAGNATETERLVNQLTRQARLLGVDLLPETVELCQQVVEGRLRARA